tara:strand:+ start:811 stop:1794 length:984 start_codon:yes stop_codon:yes gene_type:complete
MTRKSVAIIGAGLSGITLANLIKKKFDVKIFEKSRGVGGRMSTRKEPPFIFDHGAQFFKIKTIEFSNFCAELFEQKVIRPWNFNLAYFEGNNLEKIRVIKKKDKYFVGVPNMNSIVKYLSKNCDVVLNTKIESVIKRSKKWYLCDQSKRLYGGYDWLILTLPAEQTLELTPKSLSFYSLVESIKMKAVYSVMIGMNESLNLKYDAALIQNKDIAWLAINNSKPCRHCKYSLLVNSSFKYAAKNISVSKEKVLKHLLNVTSRFIKSRLSNSSIVKIHKWRYVEAEKSPVQNYYLNQDSQIAVCGDWLINSRVEGAFISASQLSEKIME